MSQTGLDKTTIRKIIDTIYKYQGIKKIILYGSRAKGNYKSGSDIDLCLVAPKLNSSDLFKIENSLDDLMLPYKIDLSFRHLIDNQKLLEHIERVGLDLELLCNSGTPNTSNTK